MLNLNPTNCDGNCSSPDIIVESVSEDDDIDISQFVESVLEEPEISTPARRSPPPMLFFPNQTARKLQKAYRRKVQIPVLAPTGPQFMQPSVAAGSGLRQVKTIQYLVPPRRNVVYPGNNISINNQARNHLSTIELPSILWLTHCFEKVKASCATLNHQVKNLEERLKLITSNSDAKKIMSFSNDLQSFLKQTELGYKFLGNNLSADHQQWALKTSQSRIALNMTSNGPDNVVVKQQILLPLSTESKAINITPEDRLTLPPNMPISVNGSNPSPSITTLEKALDEKHIEESCAKFGIKPCYVQLERYDEGESKTNYDVQNIDGDKDDTESKTNHDVQSNDGDNDDTESKTINDVQSNDGGNDDIEIIEELIAL